VCPSRDYPSPARARTKPKKPDRSVFPRPESLRKGQLPSCSPTCTCENQQQIGSKNIGKKLDGVWTITHAPALDLRKPGNDAVFNGSEGTLENSPAFNAGTPHSDRHPVPEGRLNPRRQSRPSSRTGIITNGKRTSHQRESSRTGRARLTNGNHHGREGHEFTRAVKSPKSLRASAPEVTLLQPPGTVPALCRGLKTLS